LKPWHLVREPSHSPRGSSAGSHTPRLRMVCSQLSSISCVRLRSALSPTTALKMEPPSTQSLFARSWRYLDQGDVNRLLRGHYSPVIALTDSCVDPTRSPLLWPKPRSRSLCRLRPAPAAGGTFPTLSLRILPGVPAPLSRRSVECTCLFLPPRHRPSPVHYRGRLPACTRRNDFMTDPFFETAAISLCSGPQVCSPPRSFLPLRLIAAGQPRLLRPSRTCVVASACIGYANHPPRQLVVWGLTPH
jgi:hypothetical protein